MDWFTGIIVFILIWWLAIFTVLPWGIKRDETGKPDDPRLAQKFLMTTIVTAILWTILYFLIDSDVISFREMSKDL